TELADLFDVSPKTMRELVQFLGVAGVPGETLTYQHEDLFDIDWEALEQHDLVSLTQVVAVDDTPRFSSTETAALIAGLHALTPLMPAAMQAVAASTAHKLSEVQQVDGRRASVSVSADASDRNLQLVATAVEQSRELRFSYRDAGGQSTMRSVRPIQLRQSGGAWYLRAFCFERDAERTFLVDRMRDLNTQPAAPNDTPRHTAPDDTSQPPTVGAASQPPATGDASADLGADPLLATVKMRLSARHRLADFLPMIIAEDEVGWVRATIELRHAAAAIRVVQAAPGDVIIEQPAAAREAVRQWAERALAHYDA
ncbi:MAG: WYL domain-containing protein, partial [Leucobacter sp.]|nr:WYL domain-containing protein [Leucobacter sp.]